MCELSSRLGKILKEIRQMERENEKASTLLAAMEKIKLGIITKMYRQQKKHFQSVEFGAKANNILVDGISFIEKLSFNAFN